MEIAEVLERMEDGPHEHPHPRHAAVPASSTSTTTCPTRRATVEFLIDKDEKADAGTAESAREAYNELVEQATDRKLPSPSELEA